MPKCYILIGLPGVGKSTWIQKHMPMANVMSTDIVIENITRSYGMTYDEGFKDLISFAEKVMWKHITWSVAEQVDFVIDRTNLSVKSRKKIMDALPGYEFIAVEFAKPDETEWRRRLNSRKGKTIPEHVLRSMESSYQPATLEEGFSEIIEVK